MGKVIIELLAYFGSDIVFQVIPKFRHEIHAANHVPTLSDL